MTFYEVAVAAPLFGTLTYAQPIDSAALLPVGVRVLVPLRKRFVTGYVLSSLSSPPDSSYQIKPVYEQLDPEPLFPEQLIPFFRWIAAYYHHPLGEVIRTALPGGLQVRSGREILLTDAGRCQLPAVLSTMKKQSPWMERLVDKGKLLPGTVRTVWPKRGVQSLLRKWRTEGWIDINEVIVPSQINEKIETVVRLNKELQEEFVRYRTDAE
ncbi:MAG: hypothetical protein D3909_08200 [Candidatus Electrothrix sp. ATG1]|nr:hypothetical protein [Candidatus Electrothrix sp. ATG1]